jgi:hypothetical protein
MIIDVHPIIRNVGRSGPLLPLRHHSSLRLTLLAGSFIHQLILLALALILTLFITLLSPIAFDRILCSLFLSTGILFDFLPCRRGLTLSSRNRGNLRDVGDRPKVRICVAGNRGNGMTIVDSRYDLLEIGCNEYCLRRRGDLTGDLIQLPDKWRKGGVVITPGCMDCSLLKCKISFKTL